MPMPAGASGTEMTNGSPSDSTPRPTSSSARQATPSSAPAVRSAAPAMATGAVGYAAFKHVDEAGNLVKKKGRPFGWRKDVHSREASGLPPKTNPAQEKKRGRPPKFPQVEQQLQEPRYRVYKCEWAGCGAELHNLDNLKKHIIKLHGQPYEVNGAYECHWKDCESSSEGFKDIESWVQHINSAHVQPIAWKLGDGPKGGE